MSERSWGFPREGSDDMTDRKFQNLREICEQGAIIRGHGCHVGTEGTYALVKVVPT